MSLRGALFAIALCLASCRDSQPQTVEAERFDAFWLWAGVTPQPVLQRARILYLLEGEVLGDGRYVTLRPQPPRLPGKRIWMVVRVETLHWRPDIQLMLLRKLDRWRSGGNRVEGLQIDFDARTRHLDQYAAFLADVRHHLPPAYKLSITGLLDWSANGDPAALQALAPVVDDIVLQTYQGRSTVPGYQTYMEKLDRFRLPFRIGLVEGGVWREPPSLRTNPSFQGYVVFLLNPLDETDRGRRPRH